MIEPLKFRTLLIHNGKKDKGVNIGDVLTTYHPTMVGWQTEKYCVYPQTIILQFEKPAVVTKIQILAHKRFVPEKITLSFGDCGGSQAISLRKATFTEPIGDVTFNDPDGEDSLNARELKNIEISSEADQKFINFLCMDIHKNFSVKDNKYNQVCLIALSVLGRSEDSVIVSDKAAKYLADLPSLVYVDPEITQSIQKLRELKNTAAELERFSLADKARLAISSLREIGWEHGKLLVEADNAKKKGDLNKAYELQTLAENIKLQTILDIQLNDLLINVELFKEASVVKND